MKLGNFSATEILTDRTKYTEYSLYQVREIDNPVFIGEEGANIWILTTEDTIFVVDPGSGVYNLDDDVIESLLVNDNGEPGDKKVIVYLTHNHPDHAGGARHFVGTDEDDDDNDDYAQIVGNFDQNDDDEVFANVSKSKAGKKYIEKYNERMSIVKQKIKPAIKSKKMTVLSVPGHTKDSVALIFEALGIMFTGDTLYRGPNFDSYTIGDRNLREHFYGDKAERKRQWEMSLDKIDQYLLEHKNITTLLPGHGQPLTVERPVLLKKRTVMSPQKPSPPPETAFEQKFKQVQLELADAQKQKDNAQVPLLLEKLRGYQFLIENPAADVEDQFLDRFTRHDNLMPFARYLTTMEKRKVFNAKVFLKMYEKYQNVPDVSEKIVKHIKQFMGDVALVFFYRLWKQKNSLSAIVKKKADRVAFRKALYKGDITWDLIEIADKKQKKAIIKDLGREMTEREKQYVRENVSNVAFMEMIAFIWSKNALAEKEEKEKPPAIIKPPQREVIEILDEDDDDEVQIIPNFKKTLPVNPPQADSQDNNLEATPTLPRREGSVARSDEDDVLVLDPRPATPIPEDEYGFPIVDTPSKKRSEPEPERVPVILSVNGRSLMGDFSSGVCAWAGDVVPRSVTERIIGRNIVPENLEPVIIASEDGAPVTEMQALKLLRQELFKQYNSANAYAAEVNLTDLEEANVKVVLSAISNIWSTGDPGKKSDFEKVYTKAVAVLRSTTPADRGIAIIDRVLLPRLQELYDSKLQEYASIENDIADERGAIDTIVDEISNIASERRQYSMESSVDVRKRLGLSETEEKLLDLYFTLRKEYTDAVDEYENNTVTQNAMSLKEKATKVEAALVETAENLRNLLGEDKMDIVSELEDALTRDQLNVLEEELKEEKKERNDRVKRLLERISDGSVLNRSIIVLQNKKTGLTKIVNAFKNAKFTLRVINTSISVKVEQPFSLENDWNEKIPLDFIELINYKQDMLIAYTLVRFKSFKVVVLLMQPQCNVVGVYVVDEEKVDLAEKAIRLERQICANCGIGTSVQQQHDFACMQCKAVAYCGLECADAHWNVEHADKCCSSSQK